MLENDTKVVEKFQARKVERKTKRPSSMLMKIWINPEKKTENITERDVFSPPPPALFLTTPHGMWDLSSPVGD